MYCTKEETPMAGMPGGQVPAGSRIDVSHASILPHSAEALLTVATDLARVEGRA